MIYLFVTNWTIQIRAVESSNVSGSHAFDIQTWILRDDNNRLFSNRDRSIISISTNIRWCDSAVWKKGSGKKRGHTWI